MLLKSQTVFECRINKKKPVKIIDRVEIHK